MSVETQTPTPIIELAMFKTKAGVDEAALRDAAARSAAALARSGGFVRRELVHDGESGQWIDIVHWTDLASAMRADAMFADAPEAQEYLALVDMEQAKLLHLRSVLAQ